MRQLAYPVGPRRMPACSPVKSTAPAIVIGRPVTPPGSRYYYLV